MGRRSGSPTRTPWCSPPARPTARPPRAWCCARTSSRSRATSCSTPTTCPMKGRQLKDNPRAAAVMHWDALHRQVRIEGPVTFAPAADSDRYFAARAWQKRIGAWASAQSAARRLARAAARSGGRDRRALRHARAGLRRRRRTSRISTCRARRTGAATACGRRAWSCGSRAMRACTTARAGGAGSPARADGAFGPAPGRRRACSREAARVAPRSHVWKEPAHPLLLLVLLAVAVQQLLDRIDTQSWQETLWVGIFPLNADGTRRPRSATSRRSGPQDFADIEAFFAREGHRYGVSARDARYTSSFTRRGRSCRRRCRPSAGVAVDRLVDAQAALVRLATHATSPATRPRASASSFCTTIRRLSSALPDSHGLQKGLVGVVHAFADEAHDRQQRRGDRARAAAHGGRERQVRPRRAVRRSFPTATRIRSSSRSTRRLRPRSWPGAGRSPRARRRCPRNLRHVVVGPATALEIRWSRPVSAASPAASTRAASPCAPARASSCASSP